MGNGREGVVHWNQFRGNNGQGFAPSAMIRSDFGPHAHIRWAVAVPPGKSSPVIWGDRIFLTGHQPDDKKELVTLCIDHQTGEILWRRSVTAQAEVWYHPTNSPASPTPVADGEHVYVYFAAYGLLCYDHSGEAVWERRMEAARNKYGPASSPVLHGDKVILVLDDDGGTSHILAVRRDTGETLWDRARPLFGASWSTPTIWRHDDTEELIVLGSRRVTSYRPDNGEELWWAGGFSPEVVGVPVVGEGLLFVGSSAMAGRGDVDWDIPRTWTIICEDFDRNRDHQIQIDEATAGFTIPIRPELAKENPGYGLPVGDPKRLHRDIDKDGDGAVTEAEWLAVVSTLVASSEPMLAAIRPGARGDARPSHIAWQLQRGVPETASLLYCMGRLFLMRDGGLLTCLEAATGREIFRERIGSPGHYVASPVAGDGRLIVASASGVVTVIEIGDTLSVLARNRFEQPIEATPAIAGHTLYVRTRDVLYAMGP